jgi:hypothetical protein
MQPLSTTQLLIWVTGILLLGLVVALVLRRKLYAEFPVFCAYAIFQLVTAAVSLWIRLRCSNPFYFKSWVVQSVLDAVLSMAVLLELFSKMLKPYPGIRKLGHLVYLIAGILLVAIAAWMLIETPPSDVSVAKLTVWIVSGQRSVDFVRFGLLFVLFMFCRLFGLTWRHYLFGIALGMAVLTGLEVLGESFRVEFGYHIHRIYELVVSAGFDLGVLVWSYYLVRQESKLYVTEVPYSPNLVRWNTALEELLARS